MSDRILNIKDLYTEFVTDEGTLNAVDSVSLTIDRHQTVGVIGESGCGKSVTAQSILQIVPPPGRITGGSITLTPPDGEPVDLARLDPLGAAMRSIRGGTISMIFQEPMTSLSPVHTIGDQVSEVVLEHRSRDPAEAMHRAIDMLRRVGISNPESRIHDYPHQLSGGLRQRVMIALALACHPQILIADEPTTALDVTVQAQILRLMKELQGQMGMAILFITHDLGVIAGMADVVAVMYLGQIVESAPVKRIFQNPIHPYTKGLMASVPRLGQGQTRLMPIDGTVPSPINLPGGCRFRDRCPDARTGVCDASDPALAEVASGHSVRCAIHGRGGP